MQREQQDFKEERASKRGGGKHLLELRRSRVLKDDSCHTATAGQVQGEKLTFSVERMAIVSLPHSLPCDQQRRPTTCQQLYCCRV